MLQQLLLCVACLPRASTVTTSSDAAAATASRATAAPARSTAAAAAAVPAPAPTGLRYQQVDPQQSSDDALRVCLLFRRWLWQQVAATGATSAVNGGTLGFALQKDMKRNDIVNAFCNEVKAIVAGNAATAPPTPAAGVVVLNQKNAQGPDVVGLFPGLVVLIQAKYTPGSLLSSKDIKDEFAKMSGKVMLEVLREGAAKVGQDRSSVHVLRVLVVVAPDTCRTKLDCTTLRDGAQSVHLDVTSCYASTAFYPFEVRTSPSAAAAQAQLAGAPAAATATDADAAESSRGSGQ